MCSSIFPLSDRHRIILLQFDEETLYRSQISGSNPASMPIPINSVGSGRIKIGIYGTLSDIIVYWSYRWCLPNISLVHRLYPLPADFPWFFSDRIVQIIQSKIGQIRVCEYSPLFDSIVFVTVMPFDTIIGTTRLPHIWSDKSDGIEWGDHANNNITLQ